MKIGKWILKCYLFIVSIVSGIGFYFIIEGVDHRSMFDSPATWHFDSEQIAIGGGLLVFAYLFCKRAKRG